MQHFSCDLCGKDLIPHEVDRFQITIAGQPVLTPTPLTEELLNACESIDIDTYEQLDAMLSHSSEAETVDDGASIPVIKPPFAISYDFCPICYDKFRADPLGRLRSTRMYFSSN